MWQHNLFLLNDSDSLGKADIIAATLISADESLSVSNDLTFFYNFIWNYF